MVSGTFMNQFLVSEVAVEVVNEGIANVNHVVKIGHTSHKSTLLIVEMQMAILQVILDEVLQNLWIEDVIEPVNSPLYLVFIVIELTKAIQLSRHTDLFQPVVRHTLQTLYCDIPRQFFTEEHPADFVKTTTQVC